MGGVFDWLRIDVIQGVLVHRVHVHVPDHVHDVVLVHDPGTG